MRVPVIELFPSSEEKDIEFALLAMLAVSAENGVDMIDLDPSSEDTTTCWTKEGIRVMCSFPSLPLDVVEDLIQYCLTGFQALGEHKWQDIESIHRYPVPGRPGELEPFLPILMARAPDGQTSLWNPATNGDAIQFCRAEHRHRVASKNCGGV